MQAIVASPTLQLGVVSTVNITSGGALSVVVDSEQYRVEGSAFLLAFEGGSTSFGFGARFLYVLHAGERADFSVGLGLALLHGEISVLGGVTRFHIDPGAQIRVFLTDSVAATASGGFGFGFGEGGWVLSLGGQLTGNFGLIYFF